MFTDHVSIDGDEGNATKCQRIMRLWKRLALNFVMLAKCFDIMIKP